MKTRKSLQPSSRVAGKVSRHWPRREGREAKSTVVVGEYTVLYGG